MSEELDCFEMPEADAEQIIDKISAMASSIRGDWTDPRGECREIWRLCKLLKEKIVAASGNSQSAPLKTIYDKDGLVDVQDCQR